MSNIIPIQSVNEDIKFVINPIWIDYVVDEIGKVKEKKHICLIALKNVNAGTYVNHHISNFIMDKWGLKSFNTQKKHATNTVKFLNYLIHNFPILQLKNLTNLTLSHGTSYLNYLSTTGVSQDTVKDAERTVANFYIWGIKKNIFMNVTIDEFREVSPEHNKTNFQSPFKVVYPQKKIKEIEHVIPFEFIPSFLEIATIHAPKIALGIYLQIFGGLRVSEVLNIKRTQISKTVAKQEFILQIENQNFRTDLKEHTSVKKTRVQTVLDVNGWGAALLKQHLNIYQSNLTNALFLNSSNKPMSGRSYRQYFKKCKTLFISELENSKNLEHRIVAQYLKSIKWSTHIGRGTFTNLVANEASNPYEIAHLRGDSSLESALSYMVSTSRIHQKIEEKLESMHETYIPKLIERKLRNK